MNYNCRNNEKEFSFVDAPPAFLLRIQAWAGITLGLMIHGLYGQMSGSLDLPIPWMWKPETKWLTSILELTY